MWLRIENGVAVESTDENPAGRFHPDLIWLPATDGAQVGWLYDGVRFSPTPGPSLDAVRAAKLGELGANYAAAIGANVAYLGTTFQADDASRTRLNQVLAGCGGVLPLGFYWVDAGNTPVPMDAAALQGLSAAMLAQGWQAFQRLQTLKTAARDAATIDEVRAIVWGPLP